MAIICNKNAYDDQWTILSAHAYCTGQQKRQMVKMRATCTGKEQRKVNDLSSPADAFIY